MVIFLTSNSGSTPEAYQKSAQTIVVFHERATKRVNGSNRLLVKVSRFYHLASMYEHCTHGVW